MKLPRELTTVTTFSKYLALSLFIFLPLGAFYLGTRSVAPVVIDNTIPYHTSTSQISSSSPNPGDPNYLYMASIYSPDGEYYIQPSIQRLPTNQYVSTFALFHRENSTKITYVGNEVHPTQLLQATLSASLNGPIKRFMHEYSPQTRPYEDSTVAAWSADNKTIALLLPDSVSLYQLNFSREPTTSEGHTYITYHINIIDHHTIPITLPTIGTYYYPSLFFSGDGSELYVTNGTQADHGIRVDLKSYQVEHIPHAFNIYPIPHSKGYAYLESTEPYGSYKLTLFPQNTSYVLPLHADYMGNVIFSPSGDTVCFETATSGYHGYAVYQLSPIKKIAAGQQYSYCDHWIDNNQIIVEENPYFGGGTQYFIVNTTTANKSLLIKHP